MMRRFDFKSVQPLLEPPTPPDAWLTVAGDVIPWLTDNAVADEVVIYLSAPMLWLHSVMAPRENFHPPDPSNLLDARTSLDDTWKIQRVYGGGEGYRVYLEPPLGDTRSTALAGGEPLLYRRHFDGMKDYRSPVELSQKLVHALHVFWVADRKAFCRLDHKGDLEDVIRIIETKSAGRETVTVVTILTKDLHRYMTLANMVLVQQFDVTRYRSGFCGWDVAGETEYRTPNLFYKHGHSKDASYVHGFLISASPISHESIVQAFREEVEGHPKQYATFKIFDRKNDKQVETSCAPDAISNYYQKNDLPWEVSPAFFRAEVLTRYKGNPEKYTLEERSITCRNAWDLPTFDINEAGQVHTYIGYLAKLPYEEQLYWKSFNEWPKGTISKRAHQTDIEGTWSTDYNPLASLKHKIERLNQLGPHWWKARDDSLIEAARYPMTESREEWANDILALDQLLVEGFVAKALGALADGRGATLDPNWQSLRILRAYLEVAGLSVDEARDTMLPLTTLHTLRSQVKGHGAPDKKAEAVSAARTEHGTLRAHFTHLAGQCDQSTTRICKSLGIDLN